MINRLFSLIVSSSYTTDYSVHSSHFNLEKVASPTLKLQEKPIFARSSCPSSPNCRYKTSEIDVNEFLANVAAVNDLRNSPLKLCLRCQKTFQGNISTLRCHHSHIADILLFEITYIFARRRLLLR